MSIAAKKVIASTLVAIALTACGKNEGNQTTTTMQPTAQPTASATKFTENQNQSLVIVKNSSGFDVNACAETYGISLGMIEVAKVNQNFKSVWESEAMGGASVETHRDLAESVADSAEKYGLMNATLRGAKKASASAFVAAAGATANQGKFSEYMNNAIVESASYDKICTDAIMQVLKNM